MKTQDIKELDVEKITNEIIDTISSHYEKEIKVLHKALELACKNLLVVDEHTQYAFGEDYIGVMDYYIEQAKENIDETHND